MSDFEVHPTGTALRLAKAEALEQGRLQPLYSPKANSITLIASSGTAHFAWDVETARRFHCDLGEALRLAACRDEPRSAVGGASA
jgi:hypothetical protein